MPWGLAQPVLKDYHGYWKQSLCSTIIPFTVFSILNIVLFSLKCDILDYMPSQHTDIPHGMLSTLAIPLIKWMSSLIQGCCFFFFSNKEEVVPAKRKLIFEDNEVDEDTQSQSQQEDSGDSQVSSLAFYCLPTWQTTWIPQDLEFWIENSRNSHEIGKPGGLIWFTQIIY